LCFLFCREALRFSLSSPVLSHPLLHLLILSLTLSLISSFSHSPSLSSPCSFSHPLSHLIILFHPLHPVEELSGRSRRPNPHSQFARQLLCEEKVSRDAALKTVDSTFLLSSAQNDVYCRFKTLVRSILLPSHSPPFIPSLPVTWLTLSLLPPSDPNLSPLSFSYHSSNSSRPHRVIISLTLFFSSPYSLSHLLTTSRTPLFLFSSFLSHPLFTRSLDVLSLIAKVLFLTDEQLEVVGLKVPSKNIFTTIISSFTPVEPKLASDIEVRKKIVSFL
jgi:hypothetical protein